MFHKLHPFLKLQLHAGLKIVGIISEDYGRFLLPQNRYSKLLSWAVNLNKLFAVKFKFSAQDRDLEHFFWISKNLPVSFDLCRICIQWLWSIHIPRQLLYWVALWSKWLPGAENESHFRLPNRRISMLNIVIIPVV